MEGTTKDTVQFKLTTGGVDLLVVPYPSAFVLNISYSANYKVNVTVWKKGYVLLLIKYSFIEKRKQVDQSIVSLSMVGAKSVSVLLEFKPN